MPLEMPLALCDDELQIITDCARPLSPPDRDRFLRAVAAELSRYETLGAGIVGRVTAAAEREIFRGPSLLDRIRSLAIFSKILGSCLQCLRREWDAKNLEALEFRKRFRRFRRHQGQNCGRHRSMDQHIDRLRWNPDQFDVRGPRCHDRGPDIADGCRMLVVYRNGFTG